jgi:hypothetical protein
MVLQGSLGDLFGPSCPTVFFGLSGICSNKTAQMGFTQGPGPKGSVKVLEANLGVNPAHSLKEF